MGQKLYYFISRLHFSSIYRKILVIFLLIMVLIFGFCSSIYFQGTTLLENEISRTIYEQNSNMAYSLGEEFKKILMMEYQLVENASIISLMIADQTGDVVEKNYSSLKIQEMLLPIWKGSYLIEDIKVIIPSAGITISTGTIREIDEEIQNIINHYQDIASSQVIIYEDEMIMLSEYPSRYYKSQEKSNYYIYTILSKSAVESYINNKKNETNSSERNILYQPEKMKFVGLNSDLATQEILFKNMGELSEARTLMDKDGYLMAYSDIGNSTLKCISYTPKIEVFGKMKRNRNMYTGLIFVILLSGIWFLDKMFHMIHTPLHILVNAFEKVKTGNLDEEISYSSYDEFQYIYNNFNDMTKQLKQLIEKSYKQEILLQKSELRQLQTQIAPHFLYNSFITLSNRISAGDYAFSEEFSGQLGQYFMFITRNRKEFITLKEELEHAIIYAKIQHTRFRNHFKMQLDDLPVHYEKVMVPRLIIQPIFENVFKYVVEKASQDAFLHLGFESMGEHLNVYIEDNGKTLIEEELEQMQINLEDKEGEIRGIANIHQRLKLIYGEQSGIFIDISQYGGLKVSIRFMLRMPEGENYV